MSGGVQISFIGVAVLYLLAVTYLYCSIRRTKYSAKYNN
jgi:CHASE3 domain sensor protein